MPSLAVSARPSALIGLWTNPKSSAISTAEKGDRGERDVSTPGNYPSSSPLNCEGGKNGKQKTVYSYQFSGIDGDDCRPGAAGGRSRQRLSRHGGGRAVDDLCRQLHGRTGAQNGPRPGAGVA